MLAPVQEPLVQRKAAKLGPLVFPSIKGRVGLDPRTLVDGVRQVTQ